MVWEVEMKSHILLKKMLFLNSFSCPPGIKPLLTPKEIFQILFDVHGVLFLNSDSVVLPVRILYTEKTFLAQRFWKRRQRGAIFGAQNQGMQHKDHRVLLIFTKANTT